MKIVLASCQNKYCGLGQYTHHLTSAFQQMGYDALGYRKDDAEAPLFKAYPYRSFKSLRPYIAPFYLSKALRNEQADIWQMDYVDAAMAAMLAGKNEKLFVTVHDAIPFVYAPSRVAFSVYKYELSKTLKKAQAIITVSEHARHELLKYTDVRPDKVHAIHNGIDHTKYYPSSSETKSEVFIIKYLGGLGVPHKNARTLLETAALLKDQGVQFKMEIGGYLPENHPLRVLARQGELEQVHFVGFVHEDQMREFYQEADLFFFPSLLEGFGFPPLEAMACGTPALVSDIPVLRETLGDAAFFSKPSAEEFTKHIKKIMHSPALLKEMQERAIKQASKYTWQRTAASMIQLYQQEA